MRTDFVDPGDFPPQLHFCSWFSGQFLRKIEYFAEYAQKPYTFFGISPTFYHKFDLGTNESTNAFILLYESVSR